MRREKETHVLHCALVVLVGEDILLILTRVLHHCDVPVAVWSSQAAWPRGCFAQSIDALSEEQYSHWHCTWAMGSAGQCGFSEGGHVMQGTVAVSW